jgi:hypothetical protein
MSAAKGKARVVEIANQESKSEPETNLDGYESLSDSPPSGASDRRIPGVCQNGKLVMNTFGHATTEPSRIGANTCRTSEIQVVFILKSQTCNKENP